MKPGRELDVLVAEKVMGWSRYYPRGINNPNDEIDSWYITPDRPACRGSVSDFQPSQSIAIVWLALMKMRRDGYNVSIQSLDEGDGIWWSVGVGEAMMEGKEEEIPAMICLTILKALNVGVSDA